MANDININESAILEMLNEKIDYDGGNYKSSGLANYVVDRTGDTMTGSLISQQDSYFQFVAKSTLIDATATPASTQHVGIDFKDKNNVRLGWFGICHDKSGATYASLINFSGVSDGFMFPRCTAKATTTSSASNYKVAVIVQNYVSGTSWYRVWSDGWIEQGGFYNNIPSNATFAIKLLKNFSNTNYNISFTQRHDGVVADSKNENEWVSAVSTSQITVYNSRDAGGGIYWRACGY